MENVIPFPAPSANAGKFVVGQTYFCRSICDYDCKFVFTVTARTDKSVTLSGDFCGGEKIQTKRVKVRDGVETLKPHGSFSMAPVLRAA